MVPLACSELSNSVNEVHEGRGLSLRPRFVVLGGQYSFAAITRIRATARTVATNTVVATQVFEVNPADANWDIHLDVPSDAGTIVVLLELVSVTNGTETVEFSGETAPIVVQPGVANAPTADVPLVPGPADNLTVTSVTVSPHGQTVVEGATVQLTGSLTGGGASAHAVWSTLDAAVGTVNASGLVTTLRNGTARIVAQAGLRADTVIITATQRVASIVVAPATQQLTSVGSEATYTARVLDPRGAEITGAGVNWSAANTAVATSQGGGRFRAAGNGTTQVTATSATVATVSGSASLVVAQRVARLSVTPAIATLTAIGATQGYTAAATDANGNAMAATVVWRIANSAIASVNASGVVTAVAPGTTDVIAVANAGSPDSVTARATVVVAPRTANMTLTPTSVTLTSIGATQRFTPNATDATGHFVSPDVTFRSTNEAVVTVDGAGTATARGVGTAQIEAVANAGQADEVVARASVTVTQRAARIELTPATPTLNSIGATQQFTAVVKDANGNVMTAPVTWRTSNAATATINATGLATAQAAGTTTITALVNAGTADEVSAATVLTVTQRAARVDVTPSTATVGAVGATQQYSAVVKDGNGNTMNAVVTWQTADGAVATIDENGLATATGGGTTEIRAVVNAGLPTAVTGTASLTVRQTVATITLTPSAATLTSIDETVQLHAEARDANGNVIPDAALVWSSADGTIASVVDGNVTANAQGTVMITASANGMSAAASITVRQAAARLAIEPARDSVLVGATVTLAATAYDALGNPINNAAFVWSSSDNGKATVDIHGVVTTHAAGTVTITARSRGLSTTATIIITQPVFIGGGDLIVFNDIDVFSGYSAGNPDNAQLMRNLLQVGTKPGSGEVWFDCAHGRYSYGCNGYVSVADNTVTEVGDVLVHRDEGTLNTIPPNVKAVFIWMPYYALSASEINSLKSFMGGGGRVVVFAEHYGFPEENANVTAFMAAMGSTMVVNGDCFSGLSTSVASTDLMAGIESILFGCTSWLSGLGARDAALVFAGGHVTIAQITPDLTPIGIGGAPAALLARPRSGAPALRKADKLKATDHL